MNGELPGILDAAEADGVIMNLEEILKVDAFVDANRENASRRAESSTVCLLARYTSSEASEECDGT